MADLGSTKVFGDLTVAGDIRIGGASGNITAPDFIQSSAQSTNAAACTRKDYVDSAIAAGDALQVSKTGDTMTGNLTAPKVLVSGAQGTEANALTRKDYVDAELAKKLDLAGGTLTGNLTAPAVLVSSAQNTSANALTRKDYVDSAIAAGDALQVSKAGDTMTGNLTAPAVLVSSAQNTSINALTRKDYVDSAIATGDALQVSKSGDTMTGNLTVPKVLVSGTQGTEANALTRKDYVDSAIAAGDALQVSKSGDTMTGLLTITKNDNAITLNPPDGTASFILGQQGGTGSWYIGKGSSSSNDITLNSYVHSTYISLSSDRININKNIVSSVAQSSLANALTRKDYVDSAISAGDALQVSKSGDTMTGNLFAPTVFVSSAQNASPNALTRKDYVDSQVATRVTAAQIGNALASMAYDAVGQYAMLWVAVDKGTWLVPGTVLPGSQLRYSTAEGKEPGGAPPGNWRLHGRTNQGGQWGAWNVSLWQRVS